MRARKRWRVLAMLVALATAAGCARPLVARAPVIYPARVPIRAFPNILITGDSLPEGDLAERLRAHVAADGRHEARRVEVAALEPWRASGAILPFTLVVLIEAAIDADVQQQWDVVPVQYCDFYWGCYTDLQSVYGATSRVFGDVELTVYDGPSARPLQREQFQAVIYERDTPEVRQQVFEQLATQLTRAVDVLKSELRVELEPVDLPLVQQALQEIRRGQWEQGRRLLEQAAQQLAGQKRRVQARVWYDLGLARWHAPGPDGLSEEAFQATRRALERAIQLDQTPRYRTALERLDQARRRQQVLEEQRRATSHNFALRDATLGSP